MYHGSSNCRNYSHLYGLAKKKKKKKEEEQEEEEKRLTLLKLRNLKERACRSGTQA